MIMKNLRVIILCLLALLLIGGYGCGGGSDGGGNSESNTDETTQEQTEDETSETDETVSRVLNKLLEAGADGAPAVFDYAPETETEEESEPDTGEVNFVKYVSSKDINSGDRYVKTINLTKDSAYVIKYSHGGRNLNQTALDLIITAPDKREMKLIFTDYAETTTLSDDETYSEDKTGLSSADEAAGLTLEDVLAEELALEESRKDDDETEPLYVKAKLEIIPEENPCIILYTFKAPLSGNYDFAVREINTASNASGDVVPSDIPFEFRVYGSDEAYGAADDEDIELTPRQMLDLQRILIESATEFNDNGLPTAFETEDDTVEEASVNVAVTMRVLDNDKVEYWKKKVQRDLDRQNSVIVDPVVNNVPYDDIFEEGAGFYAHSGLRAIGGEAVDMDDYLFSDNAVEDFNGQTPSNGSKVNMNEDLKVNLIATEEEHDRVMGLDAMSNFALIRNALGYNGTDDKVRLGSNSARVMSVRYDYIEQSPRYFTSDKYHLTDVAMYLLKNDYNAFQREHGDYFVAGYTWGLCYDAVIEITAVHMRCFHTKVLSRYSDGHVYSMTGVGDPGQVCDDVAAVLKEIFSRAKANAMSIRNTGRASQSDVNRINELITLITTNRTGEWFRYYDEAFGGVTISVKINKRTGVDSESTLSLKGFVDALTNFMAKAPSTNKAQYEPLYVTLMRYRELEEAKPYIKEALAVEKKHYNKIRDLTTKIYRTRCYYNGIMSIPDDHWLNGATTRINLGNQFTDLVSDMNGQLNEICSDINNVNECYAVFDELYNNYKALAERYAFYRYFVDYQTNHAEGDGWDEPCGTGGCIGGFEKYDKSAIVQQDFGGYYKRDHEEPCTGGPGGVRFQISFNNYERAHYFDTKYIKTNYSKAWDNQKGTIGKRSADWQYKCASSRSLEVKLEIWTVNMPPDKYPFAGLSN